MTRTRTRKNTYWVSPPRLRPVSRGPHFSPLSQTPSSGPSSPLQHVPLQSVHPRTRDGSLRRTSMNEGPFVSVGFVDPLDSFCLEVERRKAWHLSVSSLRPSVSLTYYEDGNPREHPIQETQSLIRTRPSFLSRT